MTSGRNAGWVAAIADPPSSQSTVGPCVGGTSESFRIYWWGHKDDEPDLPEILELPVSGGHYELVDGHYRWCSVDV